MPNPHTSHLRILSQAQITNRVSQTSIYSSITRRDISILRPVFRKPQLKSNARPRRRRNGKSNATEISVHLLAWPRTRSNVVREFQRGVFSNIFQLSPRGVLDEFLWRERQTLLLEIGRCWRWLSGAGRDGRKEVQNESRERAHGVRATVYMG